MRRRAGLAAGSRTSPESRTRRGRNEGSANHGVPQRPVITVDGSDAVAVYRVASESINRARMGRGPTLIECSAWDTNPGRRRQTGRAARLDDPIDAMETYLMGKGLFSPGNEAANRCRHSAGNWTQLPDSSAVSPRHSPGSCQVAHQTMEAGPSESKGLQNPDDKVRV